MNLENEQKFENLINSINDFFHLSFEKDYFSIPFYRQNSYSGQFIDFEIEFNFENKSIFLIFFDDKEQKIFELLNKNKKFNKSALILEKLLTILKKINYPYTLFFDFDFDFDNFKITLASFEVDKEPQHINFNLISLENNFNIINNYIEYNFDFNSFENFDNYIKILNISKY